MLVMLGFASLYPTYKILGTRFIDRKFAPHRFGSWAVPTLRLEA
jgi:hypothetical protein